MGPISTDLLQTINLNEIKEMLDKEASSLNVDVINKVLTTLECAKEYNSDKNILTIIDYSLPSSEKRLWVFDLKDKKLLFNTYVSHGIKSGVLSSTYFSNKYNSKATSMGVYKTEKAYYGRHGLSLRLEGLEAGFNDNASNRAVVMHGGWYVDERFIKKYGRAGRSWGCPAVPTLLTEPIINTIKEKSIFVMYYPSDNWFLKSKFLHCSHFSSLKNIDTVVKEGKPTISENEQRDDILFVDIKKSNQRLDNAAVLVISADNYEHIFHKKSPLERMLRRQINNTEYIALSNEEFKTLITNSSKTLNSDSREGLDVVSFVVPVVKMLRGYYATEMQIVNFGKIKDVIVQGSSLDNQLAKNFIVQFENRPGVNLKPTHQFIRWLGL